MTNKERTRSLTGSQALCDEIDAVASRLFPPQTPSVSLLNPFSLPTPSQLERMDAVHAAARQVTIVIMHCVGSAKEQTAAIDKVREAVGWARAGIEMENTSKSERNLVEVPS